MNGFLQMLTDWPGGTIMGSILLVVVLFLIGLVLTGIYYAFDSWFLPNIPAVGYVVSKHFTPAHTTIMMMYNAATKTSLPTPIHRPDLWEVEITCNGLTDKVSVSKEQFNKLECKTSVKIEYSTGRISSGMYIKNVLV
jgi:hypothetical protein